MEFKLKAILIGILSSVFFATTFILNRSMDISGGSWAWSAALRYLFMIPFLIFIVYIRGNLKLLIKNMTNNLFAWILWSFVGFVLFYAPLTFAASSGPGWLVAGTWQFTIIAGTLLSPLFYDRIHSGEGTKLVRKHIPIKSLGFSLIIFLGIILIQLEQTNGKITKELLLVGMLPVIVGAFCYPLGNRKMMEHCMGEFDTFQRVLGMTLASTPFWIIIAGYGFVISGPPSTSQLLQTFTVAICSGVIATVLFFYATELVKDHTEKLAGVEATQSTEVIFTIIGECVFLSSPVPNTLAIIGVGLIVLGMIFHSFASKLTFSRSRKKKENLTF